MQIERGYARNGDVSIAYAVAGKGPIDVVYVPGFVSHLDMVLQSPFSGPYFERIASFSRLITFDKRGTGLSDRHSIDTTIDVRMEDVRAVMDAAGSERAVLIGQSEGGSPAIVFAASHPERVSSLVLIGTAARWDEGPGYPEGKALGDRVREAKEHLNLWGHGVLLSSMAPSLGDTPEVREAFGVFERAMANPAAVEEIMDWVLTIDVRAVLPALAVPTLLLQKRGDVVVPDVLMHFLGDHIDGAKYVEVPGPDHIPWVGDAEPLLDEIEEWVTGTRSERPTERILATVLFTDIVDSTRHASEMGDRLWRETLQRHDDVTSREIARFGGRVVKHTGDGVFASFPGPARGVQAARALIDAMRPIGIGLRAGLHTGECEVRGDDLGGIAVHIGSRVSSEAAAGEVLVSSTVKDLVAGSGLRFEDRGPHVLKGMADEWRLYAVTG